MRKEKRFTLTNQFVIKQNQNWFANLVDISRSGACIKTKEAIKSGERINLEVNINDRKINLAGKVVHLLADEYAGIEFDDVVISDERMKVSKIRRAYLSQIDHFNFIRQIDN